MPAARSFWNLFMAGFWGMAGLGVDDSGPAGTTGEVGLLPDLNPAPSTPPEPFLRDESEEGFPAPPLLSRLATELSAPPLTLEDREEVVPGPYGSLALLFLGGGGGGTFFPLSDAAAEDSSFSAGKGLLGKGMLLKAERVLEGDMAR